MNIFKRWFEQFKAWRRGEVMIKGASRGRCFQKKDESDSPKPKPNDGVKRVKLTPKLKLVSMKVTRADGTVEIITNG